MIRLNLKKEPHWLDLADGLRVRVRPLGAALMAAAATSPALRTLPPEANADVRLLALSCEIAKLAILEWEGVAGEDDEPVEPTAENIAALMDLYVVANAFMDRYVVPHLTLSAEKNV